MARQTMPRSLTATVSTAALAHNLSVVRLRAPLAKAWGVVKADAYGHGLDVAMRGLAEAGTGIVVISSELPELIGLCDRVLVISEGRLAGTLSGPEITERNIMTLAAPGALAAAGA